MADDDHSGTKPAPVVLRIKLRFDDVDTFIERFAVNIGRAGLFVHSKTPRPVATEIKFELRLADDKPILVGIGVVRESRAPDPDRPRDPSGMMIGFTRVTRDSRDLLLRVLEYRKRSGLSDGPGGMPQINGDRDQSGARPLPVPSLESSPVVVAVPTFESQPVAMPPQGMTTVASATAAAATAASASVMAASIAAASIAAATTAAANEPPPPAPLIPPAPLAPEPQRRTRPRPQDLIAAAGSAMAITTTAVDDTVDVARVVARARTIVPGDLDDELAALGTDGADATPAALLSADEASNRLAAMLGVAVRRSPTSRPARAASERAFAERTAAEEGARARAAADRAAADHAAEAAAAARREAERLAAEQRAADLAAAQDRTAQRAAERFAEAERTEVRRAEDVRIAAERAEAEQRAADRAAARLAVDRDAAAERLAEAERHAEAERQAEALLIAEAERAAEADRIAEAERAEWLAGAERAERTDAARIAEAERMAAVIADPELAAEAAWHAGAAAAEYADEEDPPFEEADWQAAERHADAERHTDAERAAQEQAERIVADLAEAEQVAEAERADSRRVGAGRLAAARAAAERAEADRRTAARATREAERQAAEREAERVAAVRADAERADAERADAELAEVERAEAEIRRASSPVIDLDDESTAAAIDPPVGVDGEVIAPDAIATFPSTRRPFAPLPEEDRGIDVVRALGRETPGSSIGVSSEPGFTPDGFGDDPDTGYGSEIPGRVRRWVPRLESDIENAVESVLTETDDVDDTAAPPPASELVHVKARPVPAREETLDGFEILSEADAGDGVAEAPETLAIPSAIPSESAYRPTALDPFDDDDDAPIHAVPRRTRSALRDAEELRVAPEDPAHPGEYSISRAHASSGEGSLDFGDLPVDPIESLDDGMRPPPDDLDREPPEGLRDPPEHLDPDDFRRFSPSYDATPEPMEDFADRLDLESRSLSLRGTLDEPADYAGPGRATSESSDLYIPADDLRAGIRDASDLYGGDAAEDDLGDLADPPAPEVLEDFDSAGGSAPYMTAPPPSVEQVWESSRRRRAVKSPGGWDRSEEEADEAEDEPVTGASAPPEEIDLESALDALDVDLGGDEPAPKRKPARPATDDGIVIDFDDDD